MYHPAPYSTLPDLSGKIRLLDNYPPFFCALSLLRLEFRRVERANRRAKQAHAAHTLTLEEWLGILNVHEWRCAYCAAPFETLEHVRPIGLGGGSTADNCLPACAECNRVRNAFVIYHRQMQTVRRHMQALNPALVGDLAAWVDGVA